LTADPYREALDAVLEDHVGKIATITLYEILEIKGGNRFQDQARRVGEAMRGLGWKKNTAGTVTINGRKVAGRTKGEKPWKTVWLLRGEGGTMEIQVGVD
jgi:hypothetical protein